MLSFGQIGGVGNGQGNKQYGATQQKKAPIELYKIIDAVKDTTIVDTTLSLEKEYRFNYSRKDNFELLPFANTGTPYNQLAKSFDDVNLIPLFGARAQHANYYEIEDISYFEVPTPFTELYFKTAFEQGQQLNALFAINTSPRFNFSLAYKGVRSLGDFQNRLTSTGVFRFTTSYHSKDNRYFLRTHIAQQELLNEQNGGLTDEALPLFINNDSDFTDRGRLEVNFEDAENFLRGIRYYVEQEYHVIKKQDSLSNTQLAVGNELIYEEKSYRYQQDNAFEGFGEAFESTGLRDVVRLEDFNAKVYANLNNNVIGRLGAFINYNNFNYGYNSVLILDEGRIGNRLEGDIVSVGANYQKTYKGFNLRGKGAVNITGPYDGAYVTGDASFIFLNDIKAQAEIKVHSAAPNFNTLLYQSDYISYNWQNDFDNVQTQELHFGLSSPLFGNVNVSYIGIDNYTYFGAEALADVSEVQPEPLQADIRVDYLKIKLEKEFKYRNFRLANTILYQNVANGEDVFNVPSFITRNTLYYEDDWFKKALFLQTGITFKYFSKYNIDGFNPVLGEFFVQNTERIGAFPLIDLFFNAKVRQTRIFVKYENVNALFQGTNNNFAAPGYPSRDGSIRFGLVWNFFL